MLTRLMNWLIGDAKAVHVDGALYVLIAVWGALMTVLTTDEVYKYCNAHAVFYLKALTSVMLAAVSALKMFRSNVYSDHQKEIKDKVESETNPKP